MNVDAAYAECRRIAHRHGANFSVGFRFLPRVKRRAVYAAYAWCRRADDIAEAGSDVGDRRGGAGSALTARPCAWLLDHGVPGALAAALADPLMTCSGDDCRE